MDVRYIIFDVDDDADVSKPWEIRTGFVNHCNDCISLYAENTEHDTCTISDGGDTLNEVEMHGYDVKSPEFVKYIEFLLKVSPYHVDLLDDEFKVTIENHHDLESTSDAICALMKVILSINAWINIRYLST
jgi:hypothetical protein